MNEERKLLIDIQSCIEASLEEGNFDNKEDESRYQEMNMYMWDLIAKSEDGQDVL